MGSANGVDAKSNRRKAALPVVNADTAPIHARIAPHDLDAEAVVLSECLTKDGFARVAGMLNAPHFYSEPNRRVYEGITAIAQSGRDVDYVAVAGWLRDQERIAQVGGVAYLIQLSDDVPAVANVEEHAQRIVNLARARELIATAQKIAAEGYGVRGDDVERYLDSARDQIAELAESTAGAAGRDGPIDGDPLRGLKRLASVAVVGRARIVELAERPPVFIWDGIAVAGTVVVMAGGPGSGKTTLLFLLLAARLNLGEPVNVLAREVTPAPAGRYVVIIEAEHSEMSASRKLTKSCRLLGIDDGALDRVILVARRSVQIGSREWAEVGRLVRAGLVSDIALDTLARVAPADANDEQEQVGVFEQIVRTIDMAPTEDTKPLAWTVTHTRKTDTDELTDVSGSAQRTGQADTVLLLRALRQDGRVASTRVTFLKLREEPAEYPQPIEYTLTADTLVQVDAPRAVDTRPLEERILERLALGPQTKSGLSTTLSANKGLIEDALDALFAARQIQTTEVTVRGRSFKAFARREVRP